MIQLLRLLIKISFLFAIAGIYIPMSCYSQDSLRIEKFIVIQSTKFTGWQVAPERIIFNRGNKVKIKIYNDTIIKGKIDAVMDSSIVIDGNQIKLTDIKRIKILKTAGVKATIIGSTTLILSAGMCSLNNLFYPETYNEEGEDINRYPNSYYTMGFACLGCMGGIVALSGIIIMATEKHYDIGQKWKLYIRS